VGRGPGDFDPLYLRSTTACMIVIVITQVANVFACRSETRPFALRDIPANRLPFGGVIEPCWQSASFKFGGAAACLHCPLAGRLGPALAAPPRMPLKRRRASSYGPLGAPTSKRTEGFEDGWARGIARPCLISADQPARILALVAHILHHVHHRHHLRHHGPAHVR
jgi:hypothetical protein